MFQLQIINGWCTNVTNVEVTFVTAGLVTINSSFKLFFWAGRQATDIQFGITTNFGKPNATYK